MIRAHCIVLVGTLVVLSCVRRAPDYRESPEASGAGCLAEIKPAVIVEIRDEKTGAPLAQLARGVVQDGAYSDSLVAARSESTDPTTMYARRAANERHGTYEVRLERIGYRNWQAHGVRVGIGHCGVHTVWLHARLRAL